MNTIPKLEELGISAAPWSINELGSAVISEAAEDIVCPLCVDVKGEKDANLIAAAPALYDCLREAVGEHCGMCDGIHDGHCIAAQKCFVQRWREALAKAAGGAE